METASEDNDEDEIQTFRGDAIGSTIYAQRFVLKTLLLLPEYLAKGSSQKRILNEEEEESFCNLWDMSADSEVADYLLNSCNAIDILINVLLTSSSQESPLPLRLQEISLGILGNILPSANSQQRLKMAKDYPYLPVHLLQCSGDPPFLIQAIRLWRCLLYDIARDPESEEMIIENHPWRNLIDTIQEWFVYFNFILESSTETELLISTIDFIYWLIHIEIPLSSLDPSSSEEKKKHLLLAEKIASLDLIDAVLESTKEIKEQASSLSSSPHQLDKCLKQILEIIHYLVKIIPWTKDERRQNLLENCFVYIVDKLAEYRPDFMSLQTLEMPEPFLTQLLHKIQELEEQDQE